MFYRMVSVSCKDGVQCIQMFHAFRCAGFIVIEIGLHGLIEIVPKFIKLFYTLTMHCIRTECGKNVVVPGKCDWSMVMVKNAVASFGNSNNIGIKVTICIGLIDLKKFE